MKTVDFEYQILKMYKYRNESDVLFLLPQPYRRLTALKNVPNKCFFGPKE